MPITEGTQPAPLTFTDTWAAGKTTASFTPEANALLVVLLSLDGNAASVCTATVSDSVNGTTGWVLKSRSNAQDGTIGGTCEVWIKNSPNTAMTITVTGTNGIAGGQITVRTLIGAEPVANQNGATNNNGTSTPAAVQMSIAAGTGNRIYGAAFNWDASTNMTPLANTSVITAFSDTTNVDSWECYKSSSDTAGTATYGYSTSVRHQHAAVEIKATSGGATAQPPTVAAVATVPAPAGYGQATSPVPIPLTYQGAGAFSTTGATTPLAVPVPTALQGAGGEGMVAYALILVKSETATVTATNWTEDYYSGQLGTGTAGVGVGTIGLRVMKRVVPAGGLGTSVSFTIGNTPNSYMGVMIGFSYDTGATTPSWQALLGTTYTRTTASTTFGGTGAAGIDLADNDFFLFASLSPDDASSNHNSGANLTMTATGATLGTITNIGTGVTTTGGDTSMMVAFREVTAGTSNAAPVSTLTSNSSETGGGVFLRIRAVGILGTPATPAPPVTAGVASVGTVTINRTAEVVATAVVAVATADVPIVATGSAATAAPPVVVAVASASAPTIKLDVTPAPPVVASVAVIDAPSISRGTAPTPPTVAVVSTVGAMTGAISTTVDGVTAGVVAAVAAPTVQTAGNASPQPPVVASVAAVSVPTMQLSATKVATTVDGVAAIAAPSIQRGTAPTPPTVAGVVATPAPTVVTQGNATITPPVVSAVAAAPAPAIQRTATVLPPVVAEVTSVGIPTVSAGAGTTIPTTSVGASATIPLPILINAATVVASTVNATSAIASPSILASADILVPSVDVTADVGIPVFHFDSTVQAQTVLANVTIGLVIVNGGPGTSFYLWNGSTLEPLTIEGQWNGSTVVPLTYDGVVT